MMRRIFREIDRFMIWLVNDTLNSAEGLMVVLAIALGFLLLAMANQ